MQFVINNNNNQQLHRSFSSVDKIKEYMWILHCHPSNLIGNQSCIHIMRATSRASSQTHSQLCQSFLASLNWCWTLGVKDNLCSLAFSLEKLVQRIGMGNRVSLSLFRKQEAQWERGRHVFIGSEHRGNIR